mgnify:CR=1 FL=1
MRFPKYGNYSLDVSGNVLEVFATGAWNLKTTEFFIEEMHELIAKFDNKPWAALMDGRRWVLSTPGLNLSALSMHSLHDAHLTSAPSTRLTRRA